MRDGVLDKRPPRKHFFMPLQMARTTIHTETKQRNILQTSKRWAAKPQRGMTKFKNSI